jgi:(1->4)-alpha-D-glucan 1-alpha-D-glucosylmutase
MTPRATYRLQLNKAFTFDQAAEQAGYFAALGISHIYASPILTARAGSMHGYDVVDHARINPELGGADGFARLAAALRAQGMGVILDIVPNHMAVGGGDNLWWLDVLENGRASAFAQAFDIDFDPPDPALRGKVLAPFLGAPYGEILRSGDLKLAERDGKFVVAYHHHLFPIRPEDQDGVRADPSRFAAPEALHGLLERQNFVLAWWRSAGDRINWRRFFDITELAGVRVERPEVFDAVHRVTFELYRQGLIDGVRVDHVDGLADPAGYCQALRARLDALTAERPAGASPGPAYLIVEKILGAGEALAGDWGVDGTSGYDFMNEVSAVQHDRKGDKPLSQFWSGISHRPPDFEAEELAARPEILLAGFDGQLERAAASFHRLALGDTATRDLTPAALRRGLARIIRHLRVYRTYATGCPNSPAPGAAFAGAAAAAERDGAAESWPIRFIADVLTRDDAGEAARRFNQLSAPVAAKAVEDTAFYRYGRLLSRNDVGFDAGRLALDAQDFHARMESRAALWPRAMLATATHDHKRGEDIRARLAVLSELPELWQSKAVEWFGVNAPVRPDAVTAGDEYQLYQMLLGAWPLEPNVALDAFRDRIAGWQSKALREAKLLTSWAAPDAAFEAANRAYLDALLDPARSAAFLSGLRDFAGHIAPAGALNGLAQLILRCAAPGVPDLYQGTEFWDLSLVDPDNRRPVDYDSRRAGLAGGATLAKLARDWRDGRIKQRVASRLLRLRAQAPAVFADGDYRKLTVEGERAEQVLAFARTVPGCALIVAVPIHCAAAVAGGDRIAPDADWWGDTKIRPPDAIGGREFDALEDRMCSADASIPLASMTAIPAIVRLIRY